MTGVFLRVQSKSTPKSKSTATARPAASLEFRGILHVQVSGFTLQPQEILLSVGGNCGKDKNRPGPHLSTSRTEAKQKSKSSLSPPRSTPFDKQPTQLVHLNQFLARGDFRDTFVDKTHLQRLAPGYFDLYLSRLQKLQAENRTLILLILYSSRS